MYKVLIVEDESAAARYQKRMIDQYCEGFLVTQIAVNGSEALEILAESSPDLILSDVKMPVMDGIELVGHLKSKYPDIPIVMISGYQDFQYVRKTLSTGAVDYLIKPVNPDQLVEVLEGQRKKLNHRKEIQRIQRLQALVGLDAEAGCSRDIFDDSCRCFLALVRRGGLHSRFYPQSMSEDGFIQAQGLYRLPGRDSHEWYFIGFTKNIEWNYFRRTVIHAVEELTVKTRTLAFFRETVTVSELSSSCRNLVLELEKSIIPGEFVIYEGSSVKEWPDPWDKVIADRIDFALQENRWSLVVKAFEDLIHSWEKRKLPLMAAESSLRSYLQFMSRIQSHKEHRWALNPALDEALTRIDSYDQFRTEFISLIHKACIDPDTETSSVEAPILFTDIWAWIQDQYAEPLTLDMVSHRFRISTSYLSKLFRKHLGMSFGEALTRTRIDAAKRLIQSTPEMLIKDVAGRSGFQDPYYFSKVFRSCVGLPPSEFARKYHIK